MRPDPASQARNSSRFSLLRALFAALVLAAMAVLPAISRGADQPAWALVPTMAE